MRPRIIGTGFIGPAKPKKALGHAYRTDTDDRTATLLEDDGARAVPMAAPPAAA